MWQPQNPRVRREARGLGILRVHAERKGEAVAPVEVESRLVLGREKSTVGAESKMRKVWTQRGRETRAGGEPGKRFRTWRAGIENQFFLPRGELLIETGQPCSPTGGRKLARDRGHLAKPLRLRRGEAERVGEPVAFLSLRLRETIPEGDRSAGIEARSNDGEDSDAIRCYLFAVLRFGISSEASLSRACELAITPENVRAIGQPRHAQHFAKPVRVPRRGVAARDVPHLVTKHPGELIDVPGETDQLARHIDPPTGSGVSLNERKIDEKELKGNTRSRYLAREMVSNPAQGLVQRFVVDDSERVLDVLSDRVTEVAFLLGSEQIFGARFEERRGDRAVRRLRVKRCRRERDQENPWQSESPHHATSQPENSRSRPSVSNGARFAANRFRCLQ